MARKRNRPSAEEYYDALYDAFGDGMFCPVCECRPCSPKCGIGFCDEEELVRNALILSQNDPKSKNRRRRRET